MKKRTVMLIMLALVCIMLSSCATMFTGDHDTVLIDSNPSGATVYIDGKMEGKTPLKTELKTDGSHFLRLELDGYQVGSGVIERHVKWGWQVVDLVISGGIGNVVDLIMPDGYKLDDYVCVQLNK